MGKDYDVGFGKPPLHSRFKKGQSGNPKGRKKGVKNIVTLVDEELSSLVTIKEGDQTTRVTKRQAIIKALANKAMKGDTKAANLLIGYINPEYLMPESITHDQPLTEVELQRLMRGLLGGDDA